MTKHGGKKTMNESTPKQNMRGKIDCIYGISAISRCALLQAENGITDEERMRT